MSRRRNRRRQSSERAGQPLEYFRLTLQQTRCSREQSDASPGIRDHDAVAMIRAARPIAPMVGGQDDAIRAAPDAALIPAAPLARSGVSPRIRRGGALHEMSAVRRSAVLGGEITTGTETKQWCREHLHHPQALDAPAGPIQIDRGASLGRCSKNPVRASRVGDPPSPPGATNSHNSECPVCRAAVKQLAGVWYTVPDHRPHGKKNLENFRRAFGKRVSGSPGRVFTHSAHP